MKTVKLNKFETEKLVKLLKWRIELSEQTFTPINRMQKAGDIYIETEPDNEWDRKWNEKCKTQAETREIYRGIIEKLEK